MGFKNIQYYTASRLQAYHVNLGFRDTVWIGRRLGGVEPEIREPIDRSFGAWPMAPNAPCFGGNSSPYILTAIALMVLADGHAGFHCNKLGKETYGHNGNHI